MAGSNKNLTDEDLLGWIHCNNCFEQYIRKQRRMFLLSCQHISCENCNKSTNDIIEDDDIKVCPICNKTVRIRLITNVLPPHMKHLFHPRFWEDGLPTAHILRFQQPHRNNLTNHAMQTLEEYYKLQRNHEEVRARAREQFELLERTRHERQRLESEVRNIIQQHQENLEEQGDLIRALQPPLTNDSGFDTDI